MNRSGFPFFPAVGRRVEILFFPRSPCRRPGMAGEYASYAVRQPKQLEKPQNSARDLLFWLFSREKRIFCLRRCGFGHFSAKSASFASGDAVLAVFLRKAQDLLGKLRSGSFGNRELGEGEAAVERQGRTQKSFLRGTVAMNSLR